MKITREILGQNVEIELTDEEIGMIGLEYTHLLISEADVERYLTDNYGAAFDKTVVPLIHDYVNEKLLNYQFTIYDNPIQKIIQDGCDTFIKPVAQKKKYIVRMSRIFTTEIPVEANDEKEAEMLADQFEADAAYVPVMGSLEIDDVYEDN